MNSPKVITALVAIRSYSREVSKLGKVYYKLEVQHFASKLEDKWVEDTSLELLRVSESFFDIWLKNKAITSNILILDIEDRIKDVTEYVDDKDEDKLKTHTTTCKEVIKSLQSTVYDLIRISKTVNLEDYIDDMKTVVRTISLRSNLSL